MFMRIITGGLLAGAAAGFIAGLLHLSLLQPVLLQAELYETGALVHFTSDHHHEPTSADHDHDHETITPLIRNGLSLSFSMMLYMGYALIITALMALVSKKHADKITPYQGMIWGICGFIAVQLAPSFGLPPEVPGAAAADVYARQIWWFSTVASTGAGLWLIAFSRGKNDALYSWRHRSWAFAAILLVMPHVITAPHADGFTGLAPPELASLFAARALGIGLVAWVMTGALAGYFFTNKTPAT